MELELRFINQGNVPVEFTELNIVLYDKDDNKAEVNIPYEKLLEYKIYSSENRRELITVELSTSIYNPLRQKSWYTKSSSIPAF